MPLLIRQWLPFDLALASGFDIAALARGAAPVFADFVNFSFVIGMTCQTADISITGPAMRRGSTLHGVPAFFFNLGVLAVTVNVIAGAL